LNGDGLDDLIVGAYQADPNGNHSGKSYVVFGKTNSCAINLSAIADASNPLPSPLTSPALETEKPLKLLAISPLITKPPKGLFASAITLKV
jgi:hypothetical protein